VGKTKTTEMFPYAMTLVINAWACRTDVPLLLVERVDGTTTAALVKATVEVNVLSEVDNGVVLELFMGKASGRSGAAFGTATAAEDDETLREEVRRGDQKKACELLDAVALTRLDGVSPGNAGLFDVGKELEMILLDVALLGPPGANEMSVAALLLLVLEVMFWGKGGLVNAGAGGIVTPVRLDLCEEIAPAIDVLRGSVGVKSVVVNEVTRTDVLMEEISELIVELNPDDDRAGCVPIVKVELPLETAELDVAVGELRLDVGIMFGGTVSDEVPSVDAIEDNEALDMDDADDSAEVGAVDVNGVGDGEARLFDEAGDDVDSVMENEEDRDVAPSGDDSGVEGSGAAVNDVNPTLGRELIVLLESGALGDNTAAVLIVWPELLRVDVVVLPLEGPPVSGSGSDAVKRPLDRRVIEPVLAAEIELVLRDIVGVTTSPGLPVNEGAVLVHVVS
jgi:hypothetical protein